MTKYLLDEKDALRLLREDVNKAGGQSAWARQTGVDRSYVNRALKGKKKLGPTIVQALNLKKVVAYESQTRRGGSGRKRR